MGLISRLVNCIGAVPEYLRSQSEFGVRVRNIFSQQIQMKGRTDALIIMGQQYGDAPYLKVTITQNNTGICSEVMKI
jgi:hypothetical protein